MSISFLLLVAAQAMGPEITSFHPLPPKDQQEREQAKPKAVPGEGQPAGSDAPKAAQAEAPQPADDEYKVVSVKAVPRDANVIWVPPPE